MVWRASGVASRMSAPPAPWMWTSMRPGATGRPAGDGGASVDANDGNLEEGVRQFENQDADADVDVIADLISELTSDSSVEPQPPSTPSSSGGPSKVSGLNAREMWDLTDYECAAALEKAGIKTGEPDFETPFVRTPMLLEGPIDGVEIEPRWPRAKPVNAVMDCRLILALTRVAALVAEKDIAKVQFYSTYRPLNKPSESCKSGKKGARCRARLKAWEKAESGKMSQHRRATAIDIRWFVRRDGRVVDVLEHYERNSGAPPCDDNPDTEDGVFLKEFACALHEAKIFNVILTPNAHKDHHNHFHLDITPDAKWFIIR